MTKKAKGPAISREEIQQALAKFKREGGLIKKLPDEPTPLHMLVGNKWAMYESPMEAAVTSDTPQ